MTVDVVFDHLAELVFVRFSTVKLLSSYFQTVLFERKSPCTDHTQRVRSYVPLLEVKISASIIWNSSVWGICLFSPIYLLFNHLPQYGIMGIYFVLWALIQYYFIFLLKLFQLWPLGTLPVGSCAPLTYPLQCVLFCFLITSLLSDTIRFSSIILYISCHNPRINNFSKEPYSFYWRMILETTFWTLGVLLVTGMPNWFFTNMWKVVSVGRITISTNDAVAIGHTWGWGGRQE